ncbi:hypothetical protein G159_18125 [Planococcus glaciei CHR43]|uniref:DUF4179 domain-containing protein n=1 Tax=Planococcus glaciei TaxID=459472 RepID=UPI0003DF17E7|nr:DUF4179 domain-containing protein [Planococcus glaciei]ETP67064.1 hypothetical protein G159_18125 [Planococcus glaciei CHR43]
MKEQYKDWFDLDIDQIELKPLSDNKKKNIKAYVLANNKYEKKKFNMRHLATAAILGLSVVTASYFALPTVAGQIPFMQNVLTYFEDEELPGTYSDLATVVNQVQTSNGIDVMIENAVYDGTNVMITYAIQTELALGDDPIAEGWLDIKESSGFGGTGSIDKINDTTYVGLEKITPYFKKENPEEIHVKWIPQAFTNNQTSEQIEGDWQFEFKLTQLATNLLPLGKTIQAEGIKLTMVSIERSEMAAVLQYEFDVEESILQEWPGVSIEMSEVKDNLGNVYEVNGNGGVSYDNGASNETKATIYSLDERATSLTITPEIYYSKEMGKGLEIVPMDPITIDLD